MIVCESPAGNSVSNFDSTEVECYPPRFWWAKRIVIGSVALVALIAALWGSATFIAQYRLDALIASYRAAGEPVYVEDFNVHKKIPEEENAATYYKKASDAYTWPAGIDAETDLGDLFKSIAAGETREFAKEIDLLVSTNVQALEFLERGTQCESVEWNTTVASPLFNVSLTGLSRGRDLARLLALATERSHESGQSRQAVDQLTTQIRYASHMAQMWPILINHVISAACCQLACEAVERHAPSLLIAPGDSRLDSEAASSHQIRKLIGQLLDEDALKRSFAISVWMERAVLIDSVTLFCQGKSINPPIPGFGLLLSLSLRPVWTSDCHRFADYHARAGKACLKDTYPEMEAGLANLVPVDEYFFRPSLVVRPASIFFPISGRVPLRDFRLRAMRRMAATALAIRLFEVDQGHRPVSLDELVPEYLEAVPRDPFAHGDAHIQYLPDAEPPILYSVGSNGLDEGGKFTFKKRGTVDWEQFDLVFFLDGDRPRRDP